MLFANVIFLYTRQYMVLLGGPAFSIKDADLRSYQPCPLSLKYRFLKLKILIVCSKISNYSSYYHHYDLHNMKWVLIFEQAVLSVWCVAAGWADRVTSPPGRGRLSSSTLTGLFPESVSCWRSCVNRREVIGDFAGAHANGALLWQLSDSCQTSNKLIRVSICSETNSIEMLINTDGILLLAVQSLYI